jgi:hypothetical protein
LGWNAGLRKTRKALGSLGDPSLLEKFQVNLKILHTGEEYGKSLNVLRICSESEFQLISALPSFGVQCQKNR